MESLKEVIQMDYWDLSPEQVGLVFGAYRELLMRLKIVDRVPEWDRNSAWITHVRPLLLEGDDE